MKGFKEFLLRGNVIDLAVAVVIGAAFTNIVNAFVKGVINPVVGLLGSEDLASYSTCVKGPCFMDETGSVTAGVYLQWGSVLSAALQFVITAAVVYFAVVVPAKRVIAYRRRLPPEVAVREAAVPEAAVPEEAKEVALLTEIRDVLVRQR
ncbi:large conductance mechanosensitive channel protein MscL [Kitasatospora sp. MAP5-34]|uniref:large conductance mechanosensitive channel protein MscL n=1 Tax=Kitasatospora sp. MAP5-34 TaxID=3035102 RepID=UPI002475EA2B|nr:large conductance mechanosensitive channel protein MscL [Kitasatospora sp. MAP5-34]MDH6577050.1 large conductance mechanosensitive channel [Kitasatospora sp. MAP5-34]